MMTTTREILTRLGACDEARRVYGAQPATEETYAACQRGDWLLWLAARAGVDRRALVLAACECAELALPIWERRYPEDRRPQKALRIARAWARGEASLEDVRAADGAAANAAYDAADAADSAATDAARAISAAVAAASISARDAAAAAASISARDAAAAADAAGDAVLVRCAGIVRSRIPWSVLRAALDAA